MHGSDSPAFEVRVSGDCTGAWDADRAAQVVANLAGNAAEHGVAGAAGLGLGLFIAREIVQAHGGTISASGAGGEFSVRTIWPRSR